MTLRQLYYFQTLARLQHYTKAAQELHISQPSLSYTISELEKEFPAPLFEKAGKNIVLSQYGKIFLEYTDRALENIEAGKAAVTNYYNQLNSILKVGYLHTIPTSFIDPLFQNFQEEFEGSPILIQHTIDNVNQSLLDMLVQEKLNFALCCATQKGVCGVPVYRQPVYVLVAKDHPLARFSEVSIHDLADFPMVKVSAASPLYRCIEPIFQQYHIVPKIAYEVNIFMVAISYVMQYNVFTIAPILPSMDKEKVSILKLKEASLSRLIYLCWKADRVFNPREQKFHDYVLEHFRVSEENSAGERRAEN